MLKPSGDVKGRIDMAEMKEKEAFLNPYVIQMDKFADSLVHLSKTFFTLEGYKGSFSKEEFDDMFHQKHPKLSMPIQLRF